MIKNIIFDVGDVLLEYRWQEMLAEYGLSREDSERIGREMFDSPLWGEGLDMGLMTQEEVIREYRLQYPEDGKVIEWFIRNGEHMHIPRPEIWEKVIRLKKEKGYRLYLLSNYSEILFEKHTAGAVFLPYLDGKVVSCQIHKAKPDPAIYHYLLDTYHLVPEESLFFDDRLENVAAARRLGIHSEQVISREFLNEQLDRLLQESASKNKVDFPRKNS